jgi:endonuclease I
MKRIHLLIIMLALLVPLAMWGQKTLPYEYGFENNSLYGEGWAMGGSSFSLGIASGSGHTGSCYFQFYGTADPYQYLVSPELSETTNGILVEFYYKNSSTASSQSFQVGYSTEGSSIADFSYDDEVITASNAKWTFYSKVFPIGTKYISVRRNSASSYLYVDDFYFAEYSTDLAPKDLVLASYTSSTATLNWAGRAGQDHWDIYFTDGDDVPNFQTTPSVSNIDTRPYTITVASGTQYNAYIRANYDENSYSEWSDALSFEVDCYTPINFRVTQVTCNSAKLQWNIGGIETSWQFVYSDQQGFDPDAATPETLTTRTKTISNLTTGTTYYARVRSICDAVAEDYSAWSAELSFTPECFVPSGLHASEVTVNSATLGWTKGSNETQWELSYSTTEGFTPENGTKVTVNSNTYTLEGLTLNTQYYAYVRAICGVNVTSNWSEMCTFMPSHTITVNDQTSYNSTVPFYGSQVSGTTNSQFIIPSDALSSIENATIEKMVLYSYIYSSIDWGAATFDVCMKEVEEATFSSTAMDWSDTTRVYYGRVSVSGSQMEISFKKSYTYHGGNLLVGFAQTASGTANTSYWYGATTTSNTALASYGGGSGFVQFLPKTTFHYTPGEAPTCIKPNNLAANSITNNSAVLTWDAGDGNNWNVQYRASSASEWTSAASVSNPTCTLSGLHAATRYVARVQTQCDGDDVSLWRTVSFATECDPVSLPFFHNFDNDETGSDAGLPQCWTKINDAGAVYPYIMGSNSYSGSNCLFFYRLASYYGENQLAVLPDMAMDLRSLQLSFYAKLGSGTNKALAIGVMIDPNDASTFVKIEDVTIASTTYDLYTVSFDSYTGDGQYIAFKCEPDSYDMTQYYVDDINVTTNSICFAPENPQISDITANSAVFTWTPGSAVTDWQVQYKKTSDAEWSESITVSETPSFTLSNLATATEYQARVRTDCGNDNYSDWVTSEPFQTACGYMALPYSHNFDNDATGQVAPTCWYFSDGQYPRIYESASMAYSGSNFLLMQKSNESACYVALPAVNTTDNPINSLKLTFRARLWNSTYMSMYLSIGVMTDPNDIDTYQFITSVNVRNSYSLYEVYFDNYVGEGQYIVLRCYNTSNYYCVDDIKVSVAPSCRQPLELNGNYSSAHEANISWKTRDLRQCNYQVSYSTTEDFEPEDGTIVDVEFENTLVNAGTDYRYYDLTCLNANTTYYFYVRANCGNGDFSEWSDDYASITTGEACLGPDYVMFDAKNTYVKFEWQGDVDTEWEFQYKESSSDEWITPSDFVVTPGYELYLTYTLHGLTPDTDYDARLRKHCGMYSCPEVDDGYSDWYELGFSTYDGCWDGDPWMCTSHLGTQATLRWSNNAPSMRWQIRYRLSNEYDYPEGNIVTTEILPEASLQQYTLTGLETNSTYYWQVRGYCDEESQSDWSDEDYFFTRSTDGYITVDKAHPYYEDFENGMPEDWSRMNLYNYNLEHYDMWQCIESSSSTWESFPASYCISSCRECMSWASPGSMILMPAIHIDENATSAVLSFWSKDAFNDSDARGTKLIWVNGNYLSTDYTAFDLGCVYQKGSKAGYWRQCFVNLDDYIGQTVIIAFDYVVAHNYNNYDWWVDNVRLQVFDKVGGSGENVTSGDWNNGDFWGGSVPDSNDDVIINANVTIPEGVVAEANQIIINTDTINVGGGRLQKFGKLIIADGGQLKVNNEVEATMQKTINAYTRGGNGWYLIAPPVQEELDPEDVEDVITTESTYDLYKFDGSYEGAEWRNYKQGDNTIIFQNGQGYLYANSLGNMPTFTGTVLPSNQTKTVDLDFAETTFGAWNLVGNPFTCDAYLSGNRSFYRLVETNEGSKIMLATDNVIAPMEGVFVQANDDDDAVSFTTTEPQIGEGMNFSLRKANSHRDSASTSSTTLDCAGIRFGEGQNLGKFGIMASPDKLYIPEEGRHYAVVHAVPVGELPLNFEAADNDSYTINFENETEGLMYCHLIDNLTGDDIDLLQQPEYTFSARKSDYPSRFRVVFVANGTSTGSGTDGQTFAFYSNGNWIIANEGRATMQVIDINGRILSSEQINGCAETRINAAAGVYVIRLISGENVKAQKVVIK